MKIKEKTKFDYKIRTKITDIVEALPN